MKDDITPSLILVIARLETVTRDHFARWVTKAPIPGGYAHHDCKWTANLTELWMLWQDLFCQQKSAPWPDLDLPRGQTPTPPLLTGTEITYSGQVMQAFGIGLWRWLFQEAISQSFAHSQGIAMGRNQPLPLRVRLEIRDPNLLLLPWEIMQAELGRPAISLSPQILFSRTNSDVDPLPSQPLSDRIRILLVIGENSLSSNPKSSTTLKLEDEAARLIQVITDDRACSSSPRSRASIHVDPLIQPTAQELTVALDNGNYNAFFYAGHGMPAPNGGKLFLRPDGQINGTELAQVLVRNRVILAVFNACWGAYPARSGEKMMIRSSLAEVLIHHGVPAVLAMRDSIADREALSFIEVFTRALTQRLSIDQAVRVARQQLLTLYKYNQPAWTLPILYMHPEFGGQLLRSSYNGITESPTHSTSNNEDDLLPRACLRRLDRPKEPPQRIYGGLMRVGRSSDNDFIVSEKWVSQRHGEIICRRAESTGEYEYFFKDNSRFGTFIRQEGQWQQVHHRETPLRSGFQLRFGSSSGQIIEFVIES